MGRATGDRHFIEEYAGLDLEPAVFRHDLRDSLCEFLPMGLHSTGQLGVSSAHFLTHATVQDIFVTTKLWLADTGYEKTKQAFDRSMKRLGLDYLDLYLIHQPYNDVYGAWRAMEELHKEGRIKSIGVSNFHPDRVMDFLVHNEIKPAVNQIETRPFHQQVETQQFLQKNNVQIESWGPFAAGKNDIFHNAVLGSIGERYSKSIAQLIVRWLTQRGVVAIPKSLRIERMAENFNVFDFELTADDMAAIAKLDTATSAFFDHRDPAMVKMLGTAKRDT